MSLTTDLFSHEKCKIYTTIADLKRSINILSNIEPRTKKIESALKESKDLEKKLREAVKNPDFIKNLTEKSLKQTFTKSKNYTTTQKNKRAKRRTWKGKTKEQITNRNKKIITAWKKSKLSENSFAKRQSGIHDLSVTQIKNIIKLSE